MPRKKTQWRLLAVALVLIGGCAKSPTAPEPPPPPSPPLTEKLVGRLFFHDFGAGA